MSGAEERSGRLLRTGHPRAVTAAIACGGALVRHGLGAALPTAP